MSSAEHDKMKKKGGRKRDTPMPELINDEGSSSGVEIPSLTDEMANITETLATTSLNELQSKDYRHVLGIVDQLRLSGLGSILQLPQLVVCGDQSSGKSSVLEAITEVPFPRKENLCTRFATEITMRRSRTETIATKIIPDQGRPEEEKKKLLAFRESITDFSQLPELMDMATAAMGLDGDTTSSRGTKAFTRDVLSIEISGPSRPQLTLVDLPGLIHTATKEQTSEDVKLIHDLVGDYLNESRTIMLAVVSAKNDYANQGIIDKCRKADPQGARTLDIVTKPDMLKPKSANESSWMDLVRNKNIHFTLGWHIIKNRTDDEMNLSFVGRNAGETAFFAQGAYQKLPAHMKGISALRTRLSQLLYSHLRKELPNLQKELNEKHAGTTRAIADLGEKRSTFAEQRRFLVATSMAYETIVQAAVDGHYESPFFGLINTEAGFEDPMNMRRLRAAVQHLNQNFASQIRQYGHKYRIQATAETAGTNSNEDPPEPKLMESYAEASHFQTVRSRDDAVSWVKELLVRSRGRELPGNFNPLLMSQLFREQSEHWSTLAQAHIENIHQLCHDFVRIAINEVAAADVSQRLQQLKVDGALDERYEAAQEELSKLIEDKQHHPITYDPSYITNVKDSRERKSNAKIQTLLDQAMVNSTDGDGNSQATVNRAALSNKLKEVVEPDMEKAIAEDALDSQLAYFKDKVKYFIAAVTEQVVERHLLHGLAAQTLSPMIIDEMDEGEVATIAAEEDGITLQREHLESQKVILEDGQAAFRKALGAFR